MGPGKGIIVNKIMLASEILNAFGLKKQQQ